MESRLLSEFSLLAGYLAGTGSIPEAETYRADFPALLAFARRFKAYAALAGRGRDKLVLDIGCSLGHGTRLLAEGARTVAGIDAGERPLEEASRREPGMRIIYIRADGGRLPFPDGTFDLVTAFHLIEHFPPDELTFFLRETRRVTAAGGEILFVTPNRRFRLWPFQPPFNPEHRREFSVRGLRSELKKVFPRIEVAGLRGTPWIEEIERARVRRSPFRVYLLDPLARFLPLRRPARNRGRGKPGRTTRTARRRRFNLEDFYLDGQHPDRGIDLVAFCRKTGAGGADLEPTSRETAG